MAPLTIKLPTASVLHSILPHLFNTISQVGFDESRDTVNRVTRSVSDSTSIDEHWYPTYLAIGHAVLGLALTLNCDFAEQYSLNLIRNEAYDRDYILGGSSLNLTDRELISNLSNYKLAQFDEAGLARLRNTPAVFRCPDTGAVCTKNWYSEPVLRVIYKLCDMAKRLPNPTSNASYGMYGLAYAYLKDRERRGMKVIKLNTVVRYVNYNHRDKRKSSNIPPTDFILFLGRIISGAKESQLKSGLARKSAYI